MIRPDRKLDQDFIVDESDSSKASSIQPPQSQLRPVCCDSLKGSIPTLREADFTPKPTRYRYHWGEEKILRKLFSSFPIRDSVGKSAILIQRLE